MAPSVWFVPDAQGADFAKSLHQPRAVFHRMIKMLWPQAAKLPFAANARSRCRNAQCCNARADAFLSLGDEKDFMVFRPRSTKSELGQDIFIPKWADEKAREIARDKGWDHYALREKWLNYAQAEAGRGNPPKNAGATFASYCKTQNSLR